MHHFTKTSDFYEIRDSAEAFLEALKSCDPEIRPQWIAYVFEGLEEIGGKSLLLEAAKLLQERVQQVQW
jgi:hypothetical protein